MTSTICKKKVISATGVFAFLVASVGTAQVKKLSCTNEATGARIDFSKQSTTSEQVYYEMNEKLKSALSDQGASVFSRGVGLFVDENPSKFRFREYRDELNFVSHEGGMKLKFERIVYRTNEVERAEFYFHPGECQFSE